MTGGATFSADRRYRYRLWRRWDRSRPAVAFVMLNPSTADARRDDPTIRRCIGFARSWGFGGLEVVNVFALRATDPRLLRAARDPVGPRNDRFVRAVVRHAETVVLAWGTGAPREPCRNVARLVPRRRVRHLRETKDGSPSHPLYLPKALRPVQGRGRGVG